VFQFSRGNLYADTNKKNFADGSSIFGRNGACPRDRHASAWQVFMCVCIYYVYLSLSFPLSHSSAWQVLCVFVYFMCVCVYYGHLSLSSSLICMAGFMCVSVYYVYLSLSFSLTHSSAWQVLRVSVYIMVWLRSVGSLSQNTVSFLGLFCKRDL